MRTRPGATRSIGDNGREVLHSCGHYHTYWHKAPLNPPGAVLDFVRGLPCPDCYEDAFHAILAYDPKRPCL